MSSAVDTQNITHATIKMAVAMAIFGSVGFFSIQTGLPALELVFIRCVCATLFLGAAWLLTGQAKKEIWHKKEVIQIMICGVFLVLNWLFLFMSFKVMSITIAISIYHLAPVMVLILAAVFLKERLTWIAVVAVAMCFVGTLFIAGINQDTELQDFMASGFFVAFLSALFYALLTLTGKSINKTSTYATTWIQTLVGAFVLLPFVKFGHFDGLTVKNWGFIIATGVIHTGVVFYLFFDSIRKLSTRTISILVFLDPAVAILLDVVITKFVPTGMQTIGVILIFAAMALSFIRPKKDN